MLSFYLFAPKTALPGSFGILWLRSINCRLPVFPTADKPSSSNHCPRFHQLEIATRANLNPVEAYNMVPGRNPHRAW